MLLPSRCVNRPRLLRVTVPAAVKAASTGGNPFLALWRNGNPVLDLCVPVQIAIINYFAFFQDPRASRGRYCMFCLTHNGAYSVIEKEKAEREVAPERLIVEW